MDIKIIRGRTKYLSIDLTSNGEPYELQNGETLQLTVKKHLSGEPVLIKTGTEIVINPKDTIGLDSGGYRYDVVLMKANGDLHTVVPPNEGYRKFIIEQGVYDYEQ